MEEEKKKEKVEDLAVKKREKKRRSQNLVYDVGNNEREGQTESWAEKGGTLSCAEVGRKWQKQQRG